MVCKNGGRGEGSCDCRMGGRSSSQRTRKEAGLAAWLDSMAGKDVVGQINTKASGWSRGRTGDAKIFCPREGAANAGWDGEEGMLEKPKLYGQGLEAAPSVAVPPEKQPGGGSSVSPQSMYRDVLAQREW